MELRLVIKGTAEDARRELDAQEVQTTQALETVNAPKGCTVAVVSADDLDKVVDWYIRHTVLLPGYGFPAGSILHYTILDR